MMQIHVFQLSFIVSLLGTRGDILSVIIDPDNSVLHCFIYHIDVELKVCQLELRLSTALQGRIILAILTVSSVWAQSQGHASEP